MSGTHAYGDIYVQRAAAHADVTTSSRSGKKGLFEKCHLLKWTLIMPESEPLKDNVHNFQKGHNKRHPI